MRQENAREWASLFIAGQLQKDNLVSL